MLIPTCTCRKEGAKDNISASLHTCIENGGEC